MKKRYGLFVFFIIFSFLIFNSNIKAEDAKISSSDVIYSAVTINKANCFSDGLTKSNITLNKGEEVDIYWESTVNKVNYGVFLKNNIIYYIKLSDIKVLDSEYDLKKATKLSDPIDYYVYPDSGINVNIYSGPSEKFSKLASNIPIGTKLSITYKTKDDFFGYTTYNGVSGWVYIFIGDNYGSPYNSGLMNYGNKFSLKVVGDIKLYKSYLNINPNTYEDIIPNGTIVDSIFSASVSTEDVFYVNYNGKNGWIIDSNSLDLTDYRDSGYICPVINSSYNVINNNAYFSKDLNNFVKNNSYVNVNTGTEFDAECIFRDPNYGNFYLTTINGEKGWINDNVENDNQFQNIELVKKDKYTIKEDCNVINDYRNSIGNLTAGDQVVLDYENNNYAYVIGDNVSGWVSKDNIELSEPTNNDFNYIVEYLNKNGGWEMNIMIVLAAASVILTIGLYLKKNNRKN